MRRVVIALALACSFLAVLGAGQLDRRIGYGSSAGLQHSGRATSDTSLVVLRNGYEDGVSNILWPSELIQAGLAIADTTITYAADDGSVFRHFNVDRTAAMIDSCWTLDSSTGATSIYDTNPNTGLSASHHEHTNFWFDLALIPDYTEILAAYLVIYQGGGSVTFISQDTLQSETDMLGYYAVLDTMVADSAWLDAPLGTCSSHAPPQAAAVSWNHVNKDTSTPWNPTLDLRVGKDMWYGDLRYYGIPSRPALSGAIGNYSTKTALADTVAIDVSRVLQYWVDYHNIRGLTNSGFWMFALSDHPSGQWAGRQHIACDDVHAYRNSSPCLVVKYRTKSRRQQTQPWNGHALAFCPTTDDNRDDNAYYRSAAESLGVNYTLFVRGDNIGDANIMSEADILAAYTAGHEIGTHSREHKYIGATTDIDSLKYDLSRTWLTDIIGVSGSDTTAAVRLVAWPNGSSSALTESIAYDLGYIGARLATGSVTPRDYRTYTYDDGEDRYGPSSVCNTDSTDIFAVSKYDAVGIVDSDDGDGTIAAAIDSLRASWSRYVPYGGENNYDVRLGRAICYSWMRESGVLVTLTHDSDDLDYNDWVAAIAYFLERGDTYVGPLGDIIDPYRGGPHSESEWWLWEHD